MAIPRWISRHATRRLLVAGGATLVIATLGTAAAAPALLTAASTPPTPAAHSKAHGSGKARAHPALAAEAALVALTAKDTGISVKQVRDDLAAGQTLAGIAGSKAGEVKADALAALKTRLDAAVTAGKMTVAQEQAALAKAPAAIDKAMNATMKPRAQMRAGLKAAVLAAMEKETGLSQAQIAAQLKAGKSLDDIAGSKAAAVKADVLAAVKTKLDGLVTAQKLTAAEESKILAAAPALLDKAMAAKHTAHTKGTAGPAKPSTAAA